MFLKRKSKKTRLPSSSPASDLKPFTPPSPPFEPNLALALDSGLIRTQDALQLIGRGVKLDHTDGFAPPPTPQEMLPMLALTPVTNSIASSSERLDVARLFEHVRNDNPKESAHRLNPDLINLSQPKPSFMQRLSRLSFGLNSLREDVINPETKAQFADKALLNSMKLKNQTVLNLQKTKRDRKTLRREKLAEIERQKKELHEYYRSHKSDVPSVPPAFLLNPELTNGIIPDKVLTVAEKLFPLTVKRCLVVPPHSGTSNVSKESNTKRLSMPELSGKSASRNSLKRQLMPASGRRNVRSVIREVIPEEIKEREEHIDKQEIVKTKVGNREIVGKKSLRVPQEHKDNQSYGRDVQNKVHEEVPENIPNPFPTHEFNFTYNYPPVPIEAPPPVPTEAPPPSPTKALTPDPVEEPVQTSFDNTLSPQYNYMEYDYYPHNDLYTLLEKSLEQSSFRHSRDPSYEPYEMEPVEGTTIPQPIVRSVPPHELAAVLYALSAPRNAPVALDYSLSSVRLLDYYSASSGSEESVSVKFFGGQSDLIRSLDDVSDTSNEYGHLRAPYPDDDDEPEIPDYPAPIPVPDYLGSVPMKLNSGIVEHSYKNLTRMPSDRSFASTRVQINFDPAKLSDNEF